MVTNWSVLNQHSFSDRSYISFNVSLPKSHLRKAKLGPNIRKAYWEKIQNILPYITPKIKLKSYSSSRDLDKVASSLQTSLTLALNLSAPPRKPPISLYTLIYFRNQTLERLLADQQSNQIIK